MTAVCSATFAVGGAGKTQSQHSSQEPDIGNPRALERFQATPRAQNCFFPMAFMAQVVVLNHFAPLRCTFWSTTAEAQPRLREAQPQLQAASQLLEMLDPVEVLKDGLELLKCLGEVGTRRMELISHILRNQ